VGQQPNIELRIEDLPRPTRHPAAPRRWSPRRPGELDSPVEVPWGGMFGTPGPDAGYAHRLAQDRPLALAPGENRHDAEAAVATLMAARASHFGRGPTGEDAEVAELLLGLDDDGAPESAALRRRFVGLDHHPEAARLAETPGAIRERLLAGERLIEV
jgi:hypothetical protein